MPITCWISLLSLLPGMPTCYCPQSWGYRHVHPWLAFMWVLEVQTQVLILHCKLSYPMSHLSSLHISFIHSSVDRHLRLFYLLAVENSIAITWMGKYLCGSFAYILNSIWSYTYTYVCIHTYTQYTYVYTYTHICVCICIYTYRYVTLIIMAKRDQDFKREWRKGRRRGTGEKKGKEKWCNCILI